MDDPAAPPWACFDWHQRRPAVRKDGSISVSEQSISRFPVGAGASLPSV